MRKRESLFVLEAGASDDEGVPFLTRECFETILYEGRIV